MWKAPLTGSIVRRAHLAVIIVNTKLHLSKILLGKFADLKINQHVTLEPVSAPDPVSAPAPVSEPVVTPEESVPVFVEEPAPESAIPPAASPPPEPEDRPPQIENPVEGGQTT